MDFYQLFELSQLRAIHNALEPTLESIWRMKARQYSITYNTPLHVVMNELDPITVLQALYEEQYTPNTVDEECEELLDVLYKMKDPNYAKMSKEDTEALVDAVINREAARMAKTKRPTQETIKADIKAAEKKQAANPKSGSVTFGDLEKIDGSTESTKGGFDK